MPADPLAVSTPVETPAPADSSSRPEPAVSGAVRLGDGTPLPVLEVHEDGSAVVITPCGQTAIARGEEVLGGIDVLIDPGHGGIQPGAVGPGGTEEKAVNLDVSRRLAASLEHLGYRTLLTRTGDYRVALSTRGQFASSVRPRAYVSVHFNAEPDEERSTPGSEVYFQHRSEESRRLSGLIYEEVLAALSVHDILWVADTAAGVKPRVNDDGDDYYAVLRLAAGTPTALTESAFISNLAEEQLITDPQVQESLAQAIARGVERFLTTNEPGSGYVDPYPRDTSVGTGGGDRSCVDPDLGLEAVPSE
jgi:N-acetylmuramoyl-L-alanine amidase